MSKIGKKPVSVPEGVEAQLKDGVLLLKGKEGALQLKLLPYLKCEIKDKEIFFSIDTKHKQSIANWGTMASLTKGAIQGVRVGFSKKLQVEGVGYKVNLEGKNLVLNVGFSHPVRFECPADIKITVEKNIITVFGNNKGLVGEVAAKIRKIRKPDPYQGKGVKYEGEVIKLKAGKKAVVASTG